MEQQNSNKAELIANLKQCLKIQSDYIAALRKFSAYKKEEEGISGFFGSFFACFILLNGILYFGLYQLHKRVLMDIQTYASFVSPVSEYSKYIILSLTTLYCIYSFIRTRKRNSARRLDLYNKRMEIAQYWSSDSAKEQLQFVENVLGPKYHEPEVIEIFIDLLECGRADELKEAKNLYESEKIAKLNMAAMESMSSQIASLQAEVAKAQNKQVDVVVHHR